MFRIGFGYDAHRLKQGRALILGGIEIPHPTGLDGHSDADVLTHAVMDAIVGALSMGDIGRHFPDTDPAYKGADSLKLLQRTLEWAKNRGYRINNMDSTIVAQKPKLAPYIELMREKLAHALDAPVNCVNIKATTTEGMGFCGKEEGIAVYAVVSLAAEAG